MGLELNKRRRASHNHIAVGGSYTDTFIEVQGESPTSSARNSYIRWVPNNKSNYNPGFSQSDDSNLATAGYVELTHNAIYGSNGYGVMRFNYYDDTNAYDGSDTSPGIRDVAYNFYPEGTYDELGDYLKDMYDGVYGSCVFVIYTNGQIGSSSNLNNAMLTLKSWRHSVVLGSNGLLSNYSYTAVGTSVNGIGLLSESLQGPGTGHVNAASELVIEHTRSTLGHAGYGEEMSSGVGAGPIEETALQAFSTYGSKYVYWNNLNQYNTEYQEYLRFTFSGKTGQYSAAYNGYAGVKVTEQGYTPQIFSVQSVGGFETKEVNYQRKGTSSSYILIEPFLSTGSGAGAGSGTGSGDVYGSTVKNLEVYKCGFNPDADRDVAVHKWHINASNINEGPADFKLTEPDSFWTFYNKDRNLADTTIKYSLDTSGTGDFAALLNYQYKNGTYFAGGPLGATNYVWWLNRDLGWNITADSTEHYFVKEFVALQANQTKDYQLGWSAFGIPADPSKVYMAGVWVRVRSLQHTYTAQAPCRISLTAGTLNGNYQPVDLYTYNGLLQPSGTNYYTNSVMHNDLSAATGEWKLLTQFYLPHHFDDADRGDWYNNYWAKWAGEFEYGGGTLPIAQAVSTNYGLSTGSSIDGRIAGMQSSVQWIQPRLKTEWYSNTDLWAEFAMPFCLEIDPLNINGGDAFSWEFREV